MSTPYDFVRSRPAPVLEKGSTYDGWMADAIAGPSVCWDGLRYVLNASLWSVSLAQWAAAFFTSLDLVTWTYVPTSLRVPTGNDYIWGNCTVCWFQGKYYLGYAHYPRTGPPFTSGLAWSTDLVQWTTILDPLMTLRGDLDLVVNPTSGRLECWSINVYFPRAIYMGDSADGVNWVDRGLIFQGPAEDHGQNFGAPRIYYVNGERRLLYDFAPQTSGHRVIGAAVQQSGSWVSRGTILQPTIGWESVQVFDSAVVVADLGDGLGTVPRLIYSGADVASPDDNTHSSLGLAAQPIGASGQGDPPPPPPPGESCPIFYAAYLAWLAHAPRMGP